MQNDQKTNWTEFVHVWNKSNRVEALFNALFIKWDYIKLPIHCIKNSISVHHNFIFLQGKLDQYRNLQKAGKDLEKEQKIALTKWDEVNLTLEYSREISKQIAQIAVSAERDAKKQAKKVWKL